MVKVFTSIPRLSLRILTNISCLSACDPGQYVGDNGCEDCEPDYYGAGVWLESCTKCPEGKGVEAGKGTQQSDCTWSKYCISRTIAVFVLPFIQP